jgi:hypothetical protein
MPAHTIHFAGGLNGPQTLMGLDVGSIHAPLGGPSGTWNELIDTGSTSTAISPAVRSALLPRAIGKARVSRPVLGIIWEDTYFIRLKFEGHSGQGRWFGLEIIESQPSTPGVDVLIGMDLLARISMMWDGPNRHVSLSY